MERPSSTATSIVAKLSSARTMSAASLATSVPLPIATPISAFLRAGASLTPSPVMATTSPRSCRRSTSFDLWVGSTRENKLAVFAASSFSLSDRASNCRPVKDFPRTSSSGPKTPIWRQIVSAVV